MSNLLLVGMTISSTWFIGRHCKDSMLWILKECIRMVLSIVVDRVMVDGIFLSDTSKLCTQLTLKLTFVRSN